MSVSPLGFSVERILSPENHGRCVFLWDPYTSVASPCLKVLPAAIGALLGWWGAARLMPASSDLTLFTLVTALIVLSPGPVPGGPGVQLSPCLWSLCCDGEGLADTGCHGRVVKSRRLGGGIAGPDDRHPSGHSRPCWAASFGQT